MSALQIIFADNDEKGSPAWKAWRQVLPLFLNGTIREADCLHASTCGEASSDQRRIGVAITLGENADDAFWKNFIQLERAGCEFFINVTDSKVTDSKKEDKENSAKPWLELEPRWRGVCMQRCSTVSPKATLLATEIKKLINDSFSQIKPHLRPCRPVADAKTLVSELPEFNHGGALDVTNIMLAPARMICHAQVASSHKTAAWYSWSEKSLKVRKEVCKRFEETRAKIKKKDPSNLLAAELFESWERINRWLTVPVPKVMDFDSPEVLELERMMGLLTEIRLIGKGKPGNSDSQSVTEKVLDPIKIGEQQTERVFRVLVVDDHGQCWHDAISLAANLALQKLEGRVEVDFSLDAKLVASHEHANFRQTLLRYDLVLLDVYLPGGVRGPDLLEALRKRVNWLPVIVWTSSLSSQLAGSAALHNGYLFKKTCSIEQLSDTFTTWLPIGNARRHYSLLNPLFDHAITNPEMRQIAVDFTLWCLKLLDSFHAVDDCYMKFFNDHGGRHIVALLDVLEQLLRPFVVEAATAKSGETVDLPINEEELLALYLAVLCHEFGMFPLGPTSFAGYGKRDLEAVRNQHALKSFLTLMDQSAETAGEFRLLVQRLAEKFPKVRALAAVISAYHSRFLSLKHEHFLKLEKDEDASAALKKNGLSDLAAELSRSLNKAGQDIGSQNHELARRLCAVFRFADAIEMDASRVPAAFILNDGSRPTVQNREDCKRQVVKDVTIEDGVMTLTFSAVLPNDEMAVAALQRLLEVKAMPSCTESDFKSVQSSFEFLMVVSNLKEPKKIKKKLDAALDDWFESPGGTPSTVSAIAALSVLCDVVEEYEAVKVAELGNRIRLGDICWRGKQSLKEVDRLSLLERANQYQLPVPVPGR